MKKLFLVLAAALVAAAVISLRWQPVSFEERAIQFQLDQSPPELSEALRNEPIGVKAAILDYSDDSRLLLQARAALIRYPQLAREILPLYGDTPEFREILLAYGDSILPPIHYFLNNDVYSVTLAHYAGQKMRSIKTSAKRFLDSEKKRSPTEGSPQAQGVTSAQTAGDVPNTLTSEQRGWYAVNYIRSEGHNFLGQFVVDNEGQPKWIQSERFVQDAGAFFTSGIKDLETKARTNQTPLNASDFGWAAVDTFAMLGALKILRAGEALATSGQSVNAATRTAALTARAAKDSRLALRIAKYGKWPAIAVAAYMALRHPSIISDALADLAKFLGIPTWLALFAGWALILLPALYLGSRLVLLIVRPIMAVLRAILRLLAWLEGSLGRKKSGFGYPQSPLSNRSYY